MTLHGRYVDLDAVALASPPAQPPPVLAGVRGPRSLALAGRVADGVVLAEPVTPEYLVGVLEHVGRDVPVVAYCVAAVDDDADAARTRVRRRSTGSASRTGSRTSRRCRSPTSSAPCVPASSTRAEFMARVPADWVDQLAVVGTAGRSAPAGGRAACGGRHLRGPHSCGPGSLAELDGLASLV